MSLGRFVAALPIPTRRRSPAPVTRDLLELDAGALLVPASYPYPAGARPVAPFVGRVIHPGRGPRPLAHLYPPTGNPTQRTFAHTDYAGRARDNRAATRDVSGVRSPAKGARLRPWLFAGGSSATPADRAASGGSSSSGAGAAGSGCEGC